MKLIPENAR